VHRIKSRSVLINPLVAVNKIGKFGQGKGRFMYSLDQVDIATN
jgi:hypothetical protein